MKLHQTWRLQYRQRRYLEFADLDKIEQRTKDIIANVTTLTEKGQIGLHSMEKEGGYWMRLFTHILEEHSLRDSGFRPGFMKDASVPVASFPRQPGAIEVLKGRAIDLNKCIFKFGKRVHLEALLNEGKLRIAQASYYSDPSLNAAIRDDELQFNFEMHLKGFRIQTLDQRTRQPTGETYPIGNVSMTKRMPSDYWILCLAHAYPLRAFDDFGADACLVIREPQLFEKRLMDAVAQTKLAHGGIIDGVDYLDPFNSDPTKMIPFFSKHFRYAYQKELRVVWVPLKSSPKLKPLFITIGSIADVAELLVVDSRTGK